MADAEAVNIRELEKEIEGKVLKISVSDFVERLFVIVSEIDKIAAIARVTPGILEGGDSLADLDSTHLFISADVVNELMEKVDEWMDRISAQVLERDD
ncbi:unnamed protein product [Notodromas monacha]|uniref:General transcription and DNA repair factor IIH subunit TFB5 n=1 Tax=Notodromas monacha TaxID=399045 RepID=A0A7R9GGL0_9CRUS|nr:unnamed protein product [Notodromas monacha]CAG0921828.1 unnamed protein product [Notodromas monacha]